MTCCKKNRPKHRDSFGTTVSATRTEEILVVLFSVSCLVVRSSVAAGTGAGMPDRVPSSQITVMGIVYCDFCSNNSFSRHSYFLPGADVKIDCRFKAASAETAGTITFSVTRTTNRYGVYKLEIPEVDGIKCAEDESELSSSCRASLMRSSAMSCNVPGHRWTSDEFAVKSRQTNLCIYSLNALNFRPSKRDINLCGK